LPLEYHVSAVALARVLPIDGNRPAPASLWPAIGVSPSLCLTRPSEVRDAGGCPAARSRRPVASSKRDLWPDNVRLQEWN
jgi:hypothetical protein